MHKTTSDNMQRRASRVPLFMSGNPEDEKTNALLADMVKKRKELTEDIHLFEVRISEIRTALSIPKDYSLSHLSREQSRFPLNCKEVVEWKSLVNYINATKKELENIPKIKNSSIGDYALSFIRDTYPEIYEEARVRAKMEADKELRGIK